MTDLILVVLPYTRAPSIYMETYLSELLLAVAERLDALEGRVAALEEAA